MVFFLLLIPIATTLFFTLKNGIGPCFSSKKVRRAALKMLPEKINGQILELGSGWGHFLYDLSLKYPDNLIVGIENSPFVYLASRLYITLRGRGNVKIKYEDFFKSEIKGGGLIVLYLYRDAMKSLTQKLHRELKSDALVLSHTFFLPDWKPILTKRASDIYRTPLYLYQNFDSIEQGGHLSEAE